MEELIYIVHFYGVCVLEFDSDEKSFLLNSVG